MKKKEINFGLRKKYIVRLGQKACFLSGMFSLWILPTHAYPLMVNRVNIIINKANAKNRISKIKWSVKLSNVY